MTSYLPKVNPILDTRASVLALIASLDRPDSGVLKVTQQPLTDLHDSMAAAAVRAQP